MTLFSVPDERTKDGYDLADMAARTMDEALAHSHALLDRVIAQADPVAVVGLFSGGNDSTTLVYAFRDRLTHLAHVNTGIGIEETRQFVRDQAEAVGLPLIEKHPPPGDTYDELVLRFGFPGPAGHAVMYRRLKERALRSVRRDFITDGRKQRVVFVAGMRVFESSRRMGNTEETHRDGSVVWVSPLAWWTNEHMAEYRRRHDVPRNEVSDNLHMSGECLCGAFAAPDELEQIRFFYPAAAARIEALQDRAREAGVHCVWGTRPPKQPKSYVVYVCARCEPPNQCGEFDHAYLDHAYDPQPVRIVSQPAGDLSPGPLCSSCPNRLFDE